MKFFDTNWKKTLNFCLLWETIPLGSQNIYLSIRTSPATPVKSVNELLAKYLIDSGLLEFSPSKKNYKVTKESTQFQKLMRNLDSLNFFIEDQDTIYNLVEYLRAFYTNAERLQLTKICRGYIEDDDDLAAQVGSAYWLKTFLETKSLQNCETETASNDQLLFDTVPEIDQHFNHAQTIVKVLIEGENPIPLSGVLDIIETEDAKIISQTMHFLLRNMLIFLGIDSSTGIPVIGIRPSIHEFIKPMNIKLEEIKPEEIKLPQAKCPPFLIDDMTIVLIEISINPIPVKQSDNSPYAKSANDIYSRFYKLPDACNYIHRFTAEERLRIAISTLINRKLIYIKRQGSKKYLVALEAGEKWLKLSETERIEETLRSAFQHYSSAENNDLSRNRFQENSNWVKIIDDTRKKNQILHRTPNMTGSIYSAFKKLTSFKHPVSEFSFMRKQLFVENPFFTLFHSGLPQFESRGWQTNYVIDHEDMVNSWLKELETFMVNKLLPYGLINLGKMEDTDDYYIFSLTDIGRYFFGELHSLPEVIKPTGLILIQPNFDIVFMSQDPKAEVKLGQFCERLGSGIGTLFKLTRSSVLKGASNGLDVNSVLSVMDELSNKAVPTNVKEQVKNWMSQCRIVSISTKVLFTCPDKETALQIKSSGGDKIEQISDTVIAVPDTKFAKTLEKKLEKKGIFRAKQLF